MLEKELSNFVAKFRSGYNFFTRRYSPCVLRLNLKLSTIYRVNVMLFANAGQLFTKDCDSIFYSISLF